MGRRVSSLKLDGHIKIRRKKGAGGGMKRHKVYVCTQEELDRKGERGFLPLIAFGMILCGWGIVGKLDRLNRRIRYL